MSKIVQVWINEKEGRIITISEDRIERHYKEVRRQRTYLNKAQVKDDAFYISNGYEYY